jgi:hemoglobin-like flavoprotein
MRATALIWRSAAVKVVAADIWSEGMQSRRPSGRAVKWRFAMSSTIPRESPLSARAEAVVRATAGVVAEHAEQITARFYPRMFAEHPELLRVFNKGNQATGEQSRALAGSVVAYAVQLIDPDAPSFDPVMRRIAGKHMSLGIRPEQYTIVGYHLLAAVAEVLGDAVTPEIAEAWNEVYWLFATQLIAAEARLYMQASVDPAHPTRPYRVIRRIEETDDVVSLVLEPPMGASCRRSAPGSMSRCSSTCRAGTGSHASTPCPPPPWGPGCRSRCAGCGVSTGPPTVRCRPT